MINGINGTKIKAPIEPIITKPETVIPIFLNMLIIGNYVLAYSLKPRRQEGPQRRMDTKKTAKAKNVNDSFENLYCKCPTKGARRA